MVYLKCFKSVVYKTAGGNRYLEITSQWMKCQGIFFFPPKIIYCFKDKIQLFWYRGPQKPPIKTSKPQTIKNINWLPPFSWTLKVFLLQASTKLLVYHKAVFFFLIQMPTTVVFIPLLSWERMADLGLGAGPRETCTGQWKSRQSSGGNAEPQENSVWRDTKTIHLVCSYHFRLKIPLFPDSFYT